MTYCFRGQTGEHETTTKNVRESPGSAPSASHSRVFVIQRWNRVRESSSATVNCRRNQCRSCRGSRKVTRSRTSLQSRIVLRRIHVLQRRILFARHVAHRMALDDLLDGLPIAQFLDLVSQHPGEHRRVAATARRVDGNADGGVLRVVGSPVRGQSTQVSAAACQQGPAARRPPDVARTGSGSIAAPASPNLSSRPDPTQAQRRPRPLAGSVAAVPYRPAGRRSRYAPQGSNARRTAPVRSRSNHPTAGAAYGIPCACFGPLPE